jgi:predicted TPR repeat methyltransferase
MKPYARRLDGMDLSGRMLAKAHARGLYDHLDRLEITAGMNDRPATYDAVVSADTFCYFGHLGDLLAAVSRSLTPGGVLVFTVEALEESEGRPFRIHSGNGRYAHARSHIDAAAEAAGLAVATARPATLRMEGGRPVAGMVYTLAKPTLAS